MGVTLSIQYLEETYRFIRHNPMGSVGTRRCHRVKSEAAAGMFGSGFTDRLCYANDSIPVRKKEHSMPVSYKVAVLVGSLRQNSFSRMLAHALSELAPPALSLKIVEIGALPFYNDDLEADAPDTWREVRECMATADAVLFVTPEYNRSVPAVLKNAVDVLSRPFGASVLSGKPTAIVSLSPGAMGGFGANHHLRQSLVCLGVNVMASPEVYIGNVATLFDDGGVLTHAGTTEFLKRFATTFASWIERLSAR